MLVEPQIIRRWLINLRFSLLQNVQNKIDGSDKAYAGLKMKNYTFWINITEKTLCKLVFYSFLNDCLIF